MQGAHRHRTSRLPPFLGMGTRDGERARAAGLGADTQTFSIILHCAGWQRIAVQNFKWARALINMIAFKSRVMSHFSLLASNMLWGGGGGGQKLTRFPVSHVGSWKCPGVSHKANFWEFPLGELDQSRQGNLCSAENIGVWVQDLSADPLPGAPCSPMSPARVVSMLGPASLNGPCGHPHPIPRGPIISPRAKRKPVTDLQGSKTLQFSLFFPILGDPISLSACTPHSCPFSPLPP